MKLFQLNKIESGFQWLQNEFDNVDTIQSIDELIQKLNLINSTLAWCNEQLAIAKYNYNEAKVKAYLRLEASDLANNDKRFSPMLAKDYVSAQCKDEAYSFDLTERFSRSLVHISDNIRTEISALKEQLKLDMQTERVPNY